MKLLRRPDAAEYAKIILKWSLLFAVALPFGAAAQELTVDVFPEGVRFDPTNGRAIEDGAPLAKAPVTLDAARDEVVSFQLRLRGATPQALELAAKPFAPGIEVELFFERPIEVRTPSEGEYIHSLGPAHYPDILIPTATVSVPAAPAVAMIFADVFVPRDATPGKYQTAIELRAAGGKVVESIPLSLEVLPFALPEKDIARLGAVNFGSFLEREKKGRAQLLRWMQHAHAHALTVELMKPTPPIDESTGKIDWDIWADRFAGYLDGSAFSEKNGYRGPRAGLPVTRFVVPLAEWWPSGAREDNLLPKDPGLWSRALHEWEQEVKKRGWFEVKERADWVLFINSLDEAKTVEKMEAIKAYGPMIDAAKLEDRSRVLFRVDGILGKRPKEWSNQRKIDELGDAVVDLWNMHGATDTAPIELLEPRRSKGERAQFYASLSGGEAAIPPLIVDSAIAGARAWGWIVARYQLDGALNWEIDFVAGCVVKPKCSEGGIMNLDALLAYRGHEVGRRTEEPVASMRLKALRRGAQDVALLSLLAEKDPARAQAIARRMVPKALGEASGVNGAWPKDQVYYAHARAEIIALLQGKEPPLLPARNFVISWKIVAAGAAVLILALVVIALRIRSRARS